MITLLLFFLCTHHSFTFSLLSCLQLCDYTGKDPSSLFEIIQVGGLVICMVPAAVIVVVVIRAAIMIKSLLQPIDNRVSLTLAVIK